MSKRTIACLALIMATVAGVATYAQPPAQTPARPVGAIPSVEDRVGSLRKIDGYFPLYWDDRAGALLMEIPRFDTEFLLSTGLAAGLGSNDLGLDRGQGGQGRVVTFQRVGPRILLIQGNQSFRSSASNPRERKSVEDSFAKSVLWGFTVAAESNNRVIVDATDFFVRDIHGAGGGLRPGTYRVDRTRSTIAWPNTKGFPKNTEIEVMLTFVNEAPGGRGGGGGPAQGPTPIGAAAGAGGGGGFGGGLFTGTVGSVTPFADAVTLREHISLVELPEPGYSPRVDDPRAGYGGLSFVDYSVPIGDPVVVRWVRRHRLQKKDPSAAISEPVKPIEYWVDSGAPDDVKKALIEGAGWWNQAFEAAGFRNALKVEVLPDGADPMDIRYHMINWVHRSTRGWSSGGTVADPRTGEIIKATVTLGSMRDRQDYVYAMRGDGRTPYKWESAANQRKALEALAGTLKASELTVPKKVLDAIPPRPPGFGLHRELFPRTTGEGFDPLAPGTIAADVTIGFVLQSDRAARMVAQHALDPTLPGLGEVIDRLVKATFDQVTATPYEAEVRRAAERVMVDRLSWLASSASNGQVRAVAALKLQRLAGRLRAEVGKAEADVAQHTLLAADIKRFLERPAAEGARMLPAAPAPPGAPIGDVGLDWLASPARCMWDDAAPERWLYFAPSPD